MGLFGSGGLIDHLQYMNIKVLLLVVIVSGNKHHNYAVGAL